MTNETRTILADDLAGNTRKATDEILTLSARSGNGSAFVELSRRHSKRIQFQAYRILGNWEDAEDVVQDSLLRAFKRLDQFRGTCNFSTWLTRIVINSALMEMRKRRARSETSYDGICGSAETSEPWEFSDHSPGPERHCVGKETEELLGRAILRLPWRYQTVFDLYHAKLRSINEIAQDLGISAAAVKSRLYRARIKLRVSLPKLGYSSSHSGKSSPVVEIHRISKGRLTQSLRESAPRRSPSS
jgi:RNA polymerase sigma-70 factor (ECF subfamily)